RMSATRPAPVAIVFARSASATFPAARRSAMMPEPTTVASNSAVPSPSATSRFGNSAAAATARLRLGFGLWLDRGDAAPAGGGLLLHDRSVALHDEHLPCVPVRILDPHLVLQGITTLGVLLRERLQPSLLEPRPGDGDVLARRDLHAEVAGVH